MLPTLQKSIDFTPLLPNAGPTGGDGEAWPAPTMSLTIWSVCMAFLAMLLACTSGDDRGYFVMRRCIHCRTLAFQVMVDFPRFHHVILLASPHNLGKEPSPGEARTSLLLLTQLVCMEIRRGASAP